MQGVAMNQVELQPNHLSAKAFVAEVEDFREVVCDVTRGLADKEAAWHEVVQHAGLLDPQASGFESAGLALKEALCLWLDIRTGASSSDASSLRH